MAGVDVVVLMDATSVLDQKNRDIIKSVFGRISERLDEDSRFGLFTYTDETTEVIPLSKIEGQIISMLSASNGTAVINYQLKNPVAALEKVSYSMRSTEREGVAKMIMVLGNGKVDTGNTLRDRELSSWLLQDLSDELRQSETKLYWLTFDETADFRIIQSVTRKTDGAYYRVFSEEDAVSSIDSVMAAVAGVKPDVTSDVDIGAGGISASHNGKASALPSSQSVYGMGWVALASVLVMSVILSIGYFIYKKNIAHRQLTIPGQAKHIKSHAILRDLAGFTALKEYDITDKKTYIGRLPREVTERSTVVVIRDGTVGREHATIIPRDGAYWIRDNATVNGTYLNNQKLYAEALLHDGDKIRFGRFVFEIELPEEEVAEGVEYTSENDLPNPVRAVSDDYFDDQDKTVMRKQ